MANTFTASVKDNAVKIYINNVLHISLKQEDIIGFQSWVDGIDTKRYIIEFYTKGVTFTTGYNEHEKWKTILKALDELDLYSHY